MSGTNIFKKAGECRSKILQQAHIQLFIVVTLATDTAGEMNDIDSELLKLGEFLLAMGISDLSRIAGRMLCLLWGADMVLLPKHICAEWFCPSSGNRP